MTGTQRLRLLVVALAALVFVACGGSTSTRGGDTASTEEQARAEAEEVCPGDTNDFCVGAWVDAARASLKAALCVDEDAGTFFVETPAGTVSVGDECAGDPTHTVVALQNYP